MISLGLKIVMSHAWIGVMHRSQVQISKPDYCKKTHTINQIQVIYFFWLRPPLRSRSRVDLDEFFSKYGCIDLVDLHYLSVSIIMAYTSVRMAASIRSTSTTTLV